MQILLDKKEVQHLWHPCTQMQFHEAHPPIKIKKAQGTYLIDENGKKIIDAISSWWCKSLGHGHEKLKKALQQQCEQFEHIMLSNLTHDPICQLSEKIAALNPKLNKVFYGSDGSTAVEIALKMSLHAQQLLGNKERTQFMALSNAYHGETLLCMSVSDVGRFKDPYRALLLPCEFIKDIPYVSGKKDPLWSNCDKHWQNIESQLNLHAKKLSGIIVEPIVQGAGGMLIYSADFLKRLQKWCRENTVHLIADEIMTGFGRTGQGLACDHAAVTPDFICLGKGLTAGWLPLSAVVTHDDIYDVFYSNDISTAFLHSNTYAGNPLAAAVALATLEVYAAENIYAKVEAKEAHMLALMQKVAIETQGITNIRHIGALVAADLIMDSLKSPTGREVFQEAIGLGALLRPLGNTIYWLPPLNTDILVLDELQAITKEAIKAAQARKYKS